MDVSEYTSSTEGIFSYFDLAANAPVVLAPVVLEREALHSLLRRF